MSEVQRITDNLGSELGRSVALDDRNLRLLAYSPHHGPVDDIRLGSILNRIAPEPQRSWVLSRGIERANEPVRFPPNATFKMLARLCVPVIHREVTLGFLWLIDADQSLTEQEICTAQVAAESVGAALYRESLIAQLDRGRERELLRDLFASDTTVRLFAAHQLLDEELFIDDGLVIIAVVQCAGPLNGESARVRFDTGLAQARRRLGDKQAIHLTRSDHGILLLSAHGRLRSTADQHAFARQILDDVQKSFGEPDDVTPVVGIGERHRLQDAGDSYEQARAAARVGQLLRVPAHIAHWAKLGAYRTLSTLPATELAAGMLDQGVMRLIEADEHFVLTRTLECYLDLAGNAKRTSEMLNLHRTSLYYRLGRVQEIAGVDLQDGNDRLALHLGLKMARLAQLIPSLPENGSDRRLADPDPDLA